ncbi:Fe-S cluster assembly ATPase SufC [Patescibacteria group bacterium]
MKKNILKISKLEISIENKKIIHNLSLDVKSGEIHAVMGPNGSGKSTLAQTLMGHPFYEVVGKKSSVVLSGKNMLEMSPDQRAKEGLFLAFQYPVSVSGVSVQKFLWTAFKAIYPKTKETVLGFRKKMKKIAVDLSISEELLKRSLNDGFSGGEKKRIEILQLLLLKPKFVILDEVDSGLDIDAIKLVAKGIKKAVKDFGVGVLVITHYQRILSYLKPDFVHVMVEGKIVKSGGSKLATDLEKSGYASYIKEK